MTIASFLQICAGVGILVYGIVIMGESMQIIAGDRLRKLIGSLTGTSVKGMMLGAAVTCVLQSSSATTVIVVSLVDVGFMTLIQAIGVILGANIGTTITTQLIAFDITNFAYLCAMVGAGFCILCHNKRRKQIGVGLVGFGLLFIGMNMMQQPMAFLKSDPTVMMMFGKHTYFAFLAGLVVTLIVQSSAATVGLTMAIASQGLIPLDTSIALILGDNIGTTITAVLASLGANRAAKQAAVAHVMIKVLGTIVIMCILPYYTHLIELTSTNISHQIANAHTIFNVIIAFMFLPFVKPYAKFIRKLVPDDKNAEVLGPMYLNRSLIIVSRAAAVDAVRKEMIRLGLQAQKMIENCREMFLTDNSKLEEEVGREERNVNELTREIIKYSTEVGQTGLSSDLSTLLNSCTGGVGDIERMGDHATNLVEMYQYLEDHNLKFSPKALEEAREMFDLVLSAVSRSIKALEDEDPKLAQEVIDLEDRIDYMEKSLRAQHIARLNAGGCNPGAGVVFIDILSNLERVGDHSHNLAMVVFDIERMHHGVSVNEK
jgi:phosphate:Na+ symporter